MAERKTEKFQVHVRKKSKAKGWLLFVVMFGVPAGAAGFGYWFQSDLSRMQQSVRDRSVLAPLGAYCIGRQGQAETVRAELQEIALDTQTSPWLRRGAVSALGTLHDPLVTSFLARAALDDPDPDVRAQACQALGESGQSNAIDPLSRVLNGEHEAAPIAAACRAVGKLGFHQLIQQLIDKLRTSDHRIRNAAREALETLAPDRTGYGENPELWQRWHNGG